MNYTMKKTIRARIICAAICAAVFAAGFWAMYGLQKAGAEHGTATMYVICQPGDWVNARRQPTRGSKSLGRMECGDAVQIDGKTENGFAHIVNAGLENDEAWIYAGYLAEEAPEWYGEEMDVIGTARVAARKSCSGEVREWLKPGTTVWVYWRTESWCVTNRGFVMTKYLEVGSV